MNQDEIDLETRKAGWREDAIGLAALDVKNSGLTGEAAEAYHQEREAYHYAERERIGTLE